MDSSSTIFFYDSDSDISTQSDETMNIIDITQRVKRLYKLGERINYLKTWKKFANKIRLKAQIRIANKLFKLNFGFEILNKRYKSKYYHRWKRRAIFLSMFHKIIFKYRINNIQTADNELSLEYIQDYKEKWQQWSQKIVNNTKQMQLADFFHQKFSKKRFFIHWKSQFQTHQNTTNELRSKWITFTQDLIYQNIIFTTYQLKWKLISHKLVMKNMSEFYQEENMRSKWFRILHQYYFHNIKENLLRNQVRLNLQKKWIQMSNKYRVKCLIFYKGRSKLPSLFTEYIRMRKQKKLYEMNQKLISTRELYGNRTLCKKCFTNWYNTMILSRKVSNLYVKALNSSYSQYLLKVENNAAKTIQKLCRFYINKLNFKKQLKKWKLFEYWHFKTSLYKQIYPKIKAPSFLMNVELNDLCFDKFPFVFSSNSLQRIDFVKDVFNYRKTKEIARADFVSINKIQCFDISRSINSLMQESQLSLSFLLTKNNEVDVIRPKFQPNNVKCIDRVTSRLGEKFDFHFPLLSISKSAHPTTFGIRKNEKIPIPKINIRQTYTSKKRFRFKLLLSYQDVSMLSNYSRRNAFNDYIQKKTSSLINAESFDKNLSNSSNFLFKDQKFSLFELKTKSIPKIELPRGFSIDFDNEINFDIYQFKKSKRKKNINVNLFEFPQIRFSTDFCAGFTNRVKENASNCVERINHKFKNNFSEEFINLNALNQFTPSKSIKIPVIENISIPISTIEQFKTISISNEIVQENNHLNFDIFSSMKEKIDFSTQSQISRIESISERIINTRYSSILNYDFAKSEIVISISDYQLPFKNRDQIENIVPKFDLEKPIHFLSNDVSNSIPSHYQLNEKFVPYVPDHVVTQILRDIESHIVNEYPLISNEFLSNYAKIVVKHRLYDNFKINFDDELFELSPNVNLRSLDFIYEKEVPEQKIDFVFTLEFESFPVSMKSKMYSISNFMSFQKPKGLFSNKNKSLDFPRSLLPFKMPVINLILPDFILNNDRENKVIFLHQINEPHHKINSDFIINETDFEIEREILQNNSIYDQLDTKINLKSLKEIHQNIVPPQKIDFLYTINFRTFPVLFLSQINLFNNFISIEKPPGLFSKRNKSVDFPRSLLPFDIRNIDLKLPNFVVNNKEREIESIYQINNLHHDINLDLIINLIDFEFEKEIILEDNSQFNLNQNFIPLNSVHQQEIPSQKIDIKLSYNFQSFPVSFQIYSILNFASIQKPHNLFLKQRNLTDFPRSLLPFQCQSIKLIQPDFISKSQKSKVDRFRQINKKYKIDSFSIINEIDFELDKEFEFRDKDILFNTMKPLNMIHMKQIPSQNIDFLCDFELLIIPTTNKHQINTFDYLTSIPTISKSIDYLWPLQTKSIDLKLPDFILVNQRNKINSFCQLNDFKYHVNSETIINELDFKLNEQFGFRNNLDNFNNVNLKPLKNIVKIQIPSPKSIDLIFPFHFQIILPQKYHCFNSFHHFNCIQKVNKQFEPQIKTIDFPYSAWLPKAFDNKFQLSDFISNNKLIKIKPLHRINMPYHKIDFECSNSLLNDKVDIDIEFDSLNTIHKQQISSRKIDSIYPFDFQIILSQDQFQLKSINNLNSIQKIDKKLSRNDNFNILLPKTIDIELKLPEFISKNKENKIKALHQISKSHHKIKARLVNKEIDFSFERGLKLQDNDSLFDEEINIDISLESLNSIFKPQIPSQKVDLKFPFSFQIILPQSRFKSINHFISNNNQNQSFSFQGKSVDFTNSLLPPEMQNIKFKMPNFISKDRENKINHLSRFNKPQQKNYSDININVISFDLGKEQNLLNENSIFDNMINIDLKPLNMFNKKQSTSKKADFSFLFENHEKSINSPLSILPFKIGNINLEICDFMSKINPLVRFDMNNYDDSKLVVDEIDFDLDQNMQNDHHLFDYLINIYISLPNKNLNQINQTKSFEVIKPKELISNDINIPIDLFIDKSILTSNQKLFSFEFLTNNYQMSNEYDILFIGAQIFNEKKLSNENLNDIDSSKNKIIKNSVNNSFNKLNSLLHLFRNYLPNSIPSLQYDLNHILDLNLIDIQNLFHNDSHVYSNLDKIYNFNSRVKAVENISLSMISSSISELISGNLTRTQENIFGSFYDQIDIRTSSISSEFNILNSVELFMKSYSNDLNSNFKKFMTSCFSDFDLLNKKPEIQNNSVIEAISSISNDLSSALCSSLTKNYSDSFNSIISNEFAILNPLHINDDIISCDLVDTLTLNDLFINQKKQAINFFSHFNDIDYQIDSKVLVNERSIPDKFDHRFQFPSTNELTASLSEISINPLNQLSYYEYRRETRNETRILIQRSSKSLIEDLSFIFIGRFLSTLNCTLNPPTQEPDLLQLKYEQESAFEEEEIDEKEPESKQVYQIAESDASIKYVLPDEIIEKCFTNDIKSAFTMQIYNSYFLTFFPFNYMIMDKIEKEQKRIKRIHFEQCKDQRVLNPDSRINRSIRNNAEQAITQLLSDAFLQFSVLDINLILQKASSDSEDENDELIIDVNIDNSESYYEYENLEEEEEENEYDFVEEEERNESEIVENEGYESNEEEKMEEEEEEEKEEYDYTESEEEQNFEILRNKQLITEKSIGLLDLDFTNMFNDGLLNVLSKSLTLEIHEIDINLSNYICQMINIEPKNTKEYSYQQKIVQLNNQEFFDNDNSLSNDEINLDEYNDESDKENNKQYNISYEENNSRNINESDEEEFCDIEDEKEIFQDNQQRIEIYEDGLLIKQASHLLVSDFMQIFNDGLSFALNMTIAKEINNIDIKQNCSFVEDDYSIDEINEIFSKEFILNEILQFPFCCSNNSFLFNQNEANSNQENIFALNDEYIKPSLIKIENFWSPVIPKLITAQNSLFAYDQQLTFNDLFAHNYSFNYDFDERIIKSSFLTSPNKFAILDNSFFDRNSFDFLFQYKIDISFLKVNENIIQKINIINPNKNIIIKRNENCLIQSISQNYNFESHINNKMKEIENIINYQIFNYSKLYESNIPDKFDHCFLFPSTNELTASLSEISINPLNKLSYYEYRNETRNETRILIQRSSKSLIEDLSFIFIGRFLSTLNCTLNPPTQEPDLLQLKYEQESIQQSKNKNEAIEFHYPQNKESTELDRTINYSSYEEENNEEDEMNKDEDTENKDKVNIKSKGSTDYDSYEELSSEEEDEEDELEKDEETENEHENKVNIKPNIPIDYDSYDEYNDNEIEDDDDELDMDKSEEDELDKDEDKEDFSDEDINAIICQEFILKEITIDPFEQDKSMLNFDKSNITNYQIVNYSKLYECSIPDKFDHRFLFPSTNELTVNLSEISINPLNQLSYYEYRRETRNETRILIQRSSKSLIEDLSFIFIGRFLSTLNCTLNPPKQEPDLLQLKLNHWQQVDDDEDDESESEEDELDKDNDESDKNENKIKIESKKSTDDNDSYEYESEDDDEFEEEKHENKMSNQSKEMFDDGSYEETGDENDEDEDELDMDDDDE